MANCSRCKYMVLSGLLVVSTCIFSSCQSDRTLQHSKLQQAAMRSMTDVERQIALNNQYRADYAARYSVYRCENPGLPVIQSYKPPTDNNYSIIVSKLRPIELAPSIVVRIQLGKVIWVKDRNGPRRTSTRHILEVAGREMARAEGLLTKSSDGRISGNSTIQFNEATHEVLIEDFIGGAGARYRHIAFLPEHGSALGKDDLPFKWRTVYVDLPSHVLVGSELGEIGKVHGILNGKIYVEMNGQFYAFPVDDFVEEKLEFTLG
ncbi:hypothetical protein [Prosthecobacter vanneervenii]|uniref:DUF1571 domain-containing protein n=1 Tax=Prosthecobacter vanneervenii TaxID=48466 RepID=A0A7W7YGM3_9BACT|nr:hypothetical protein [Prosthecobacter vanneervenii]MBB5035652.1 hypothetical protein [Prosthecobacter vanneervenii]